MGGKRSHRLWTWLGVLAGLVALAWVLRRLDWARFLQLVGDADPRFLVLVPAAIILEQLARAWKWRQLLHPLRPVAAWRLFEAIMAGYFVNYLVPVRVSPLVRAWLVARLEALRVGAVLATITIDRLIDGVIFAGFAVLVLLDAAVPPSTDDRMRLGLIWAVLGSLALFGLLGLALVQHKRGSADPAGRLQRMLRRLPERAGASVGKLAAAFAEGTVWPAAPWRRLAIVLAAIVMKLLAASHLLWAGLAFGVLLPLNAYIFLLVFLGFVVVLTHFVRIPGGFVLGALFALGLLGVEEEPALAMVLTVQMASLLSVAALGALALWRQGVGLAELRAAASVAGPPLPPSPGSADAR